MENSYVVEYYAPGVERRWFDVRACLHIPDNQNSYTLQIWQEHNSYDLHIDYKACARIIPEQEYDPMKPADSLNWKTINEQWLHTCEYQTLKELASQSFNVRAKIQDLEANGVNLYIRGKK